MVSFPVDFFNITGFNMRSFINLMLYFVSLLFVFSNAHAENRINELETDSIEIISTTPVPGVGTSITKVPNNVQAVNSKAISQQNTTNAAEFLERILNSVAVNHAQGNPFMPDVMFRGQLASPLLGNPQGLAVFMDGTKVNESFGDTLRWDMIPQNAISTINLIPGSNPAYGLNSLGGVLSLTTKSGFQNPGSELSLSGGSWGRQNLQFEHGSSNGSNDLFVAGSFFDEDGWRDESSSEVRQFFVKVGSESEDADIDLSFTWADTKLSGTQALPVSFLNNPEQGYTFPDTNENELAFLNLDWKRYLSDDQLLAGAAYIRHSKNENINSNVNDEFDGSSNGVTCDGSTDETECPGANEGSTTNTNGYGTSIQLTNFTERHVWSLGGTADLGFSDFKNDEEGATFSTGTVRTTTSNGEGFENEVNVEGDNYYYGIYVSDQFDFTDKVSISTSGRYNYAKVKIKDMSGVRPKLNGDHTYKRFNPALGVNYNPTAHYTTYMSYSEGMRAPTPVELTCADPDAPCKLPNAFLADPPLDAVIAKTVEWGARGSRDDFKWSFALYNTDLKNDIQFINAAGSTVGNAGFFDNVGDTRRRGLEAGVGWGNGNVRLRTDYSYTEATFESTFDINSPNNSSNTTVGGNQIITVNPGNKMPNIPEHTFKVRAEYAPLGAWVTGITANYFSEIYARGDENNQDVNGTIPGYTVVNLDSTYQASKSLQIFFKVTNLFDESYENMGILGQNFFVDGTFNNSTNRAEQFRGLGAPLGAFLGIKYSFDG